MSKLMSFSYRKPVVLDWHFDIVVSHISILGFTWKKYEKYYKLTNEFKNLD